MEFLPQFLALAVTGVFAGLLAGLLGVGGGIVIVPVLFFLFQGFGVSADSAQIIATATSLATIIPTSVSSIRAHTRNGNVDFALLKYWVVFVFIGVMAGSLMVTQVDGTYLTALFGIIATLSALNMLFRAGAKPLKNELPGRVGQGIMGTCIGFFSTMVGIGGGTLTVPTLTACNYPAHRAVGTAAAVGLIISLPGALTLLVAANTPVDAPKFTYGLVNLVAFVCIVPLTVLFAPMGAALAQKLDQKKLKRVFAVALMVTGVRMLLQLVL
ncbi:sulfite exporter TauE/SafE family protein [Gynuella sunshinyii]|uniref:Probable membrane transporter protein n=1 Tax=Gynuella sunshinyii YC6258 TaxID=1445510 RepID=A0A0C5VGT6_9GAMM|nr:sulfite exporter TauE/SafE family protein [Gynuella sunshinyii]AJQ93431.1 putative permease [Gynuella sunshinyii YC6258]